MSINSREMEVYMFHIKDTIGIIYMAAVKNYIYDLSECDDDHILDSIFENIKFTTFSSPKGYRINVEVELKGGSKLSNTANITKTDYNRYKFSRTNTTMYMMNAFHDLLVSEPVFCNHLEKIERLFMTALDEYAETNYNDNIDNIEYNFIGNWKTYFQDKFLPVEISTIERIGEVNDTTNNLAKNILSNIMSSSIYTSARTWTVRFLKGRMEINVKFINSPDTYVLKCSYNISKDKHSYFAAICRIAHMVYNIGCTLSGKEIDPGDAYNVRNLCAKHIEAEYEDFLIEL